MTAEVLETALAERTDDEYELMLADADLTVAGEENLREGDIGMPPRLRISQPNRPIEVGDDEADPGAIVNSLTGEIANALEIVPLVFLPRTRVMWPPDFSTTNDPLCASDNGEKPREPTAERPLGDAQQGPCNGCLYGQFNEDGSPPPCKLQRNFLVMVLNGEAPEPAILTLQSTNIAPARQLTTLAKTQGLRKSVRFVTQETKTERGRWYTAAFGSGRKLTPQELVALVEAKNELQNLVITADVAEAAYENGHAGGTSDNMPDGDSIPF
jgi:hypothetical protein